jgi:hypothetical protein
MPPFITQLGTEEPASWQALARARGTFYHDARWIAGLAACLRYRAHWITATGPDGLAGAMAVAEVPTLTGGRRLVSYPFSFIAGPMATSADAARTVLEAARAMVAERGARSRPSGPGVEPAPGPAFRYSHLSSAGGWGAGGMETARYVTKRLGPRLVREYRATHVLLWAGCGGRGGRCGPDSAHCAGTGLTAEFKMRWVPRRFAGLDYFPSAGGLNQARRDQGPLALASKIWSRLPRPVARVGSGLFRYLG